MLSTTRSVSSPVAAIDTGSKHSEVEEGLALCLSGGGYRAMLFHVGSLWRLNELGYLPKLKRISSVSGGSITSAVMGMNWKKLAFDKSKTAANFTEYVVTPIRKLSGRTLDTKAIFTGILTPGSVSDKLKNAYDKYLFNGKTLQDLPNDPPRFVINATNVQSGALWRFMKPYMRDYRVGEIKNPTISLAEAVAASSAFPPVLSPVHLEFESEMFTPNSGLDLQKEPYTTDVILSDGGVYDNLGLETAWKRYSSILVSDAGGKMAAEAEPKSDWIGHTLRVLHIIDNQVCTLRKRQLIDSLINGHRKGTYWGIRSKIGNFGLSDVLDCPYSKTIRLANYKTRLKRVDQKMQQKLINWGYAICDAAMRKHVETFRDNPPAYPYPEIGVG